jgi:hypothetical protein
MSTIRPEHGPGHPVDDATILDFFIQLAISTVGAILIGSIAVLIPAIFLAAVTRNSSGGNFVDHVVEQRIFFMLDEPYFIAPILASFSLGAFSRNFFRSASSVWVWTVPLLILVVSVATWKTGGFRPYLWDVWNSYFGSQCGSSECAYEWFFTAPLYTSVAYTVGRLVRVSTKKAG